MLNISKDILSLTDFKRHTMNLMKQIKSSHRPLVLTVNGKAELVVQDTESYQKMLELMDRLETKQALERALKQSKRGEGRSAKEVFEKVRAKYGIPRSTAARGGI